MQTRFSKPVILTLIALFMIAVITLILTVARLQEPVTLPAEIPAVEPCTDIFCLNPMPNPEGVDLDVTYISRSPLYNPYSVEYTSEGLPFLKQGTEEDQRWPYYKEIVTFTAHISNKGTQPSGIFSYHWLLDDGLYASGTVSNLEPGQQTSASIQWKWGHLTIREKLSGHHTIGFVVDPDNSITETYETNNALTDPTKAVSLLLTLPQEVYDLLETPVDPIFSYSAEDWLQRQITAMNEAFQNSVYPSSPNGIEERVRLDEIRITPQDPGMERLQDGSYFIESDYRFTKSYYDISSDVSSYLLHELSHQLGVFDTYKLDIPLETLQVPDRSGLPLQMEYKTAQLFPGIMTDPWISPRQFDEHTALALNLNKGYRRGYFGEYLFDVPKKTIFEVLDNTGKPAAGVTVNLYQRLPDPANHAAREGIIDQVPEISGVTNQKGLFFLPNLPVTEQLITATQHKLYANPFGNINVLGNNGVFLMEIIKDEHTEYHWVNIALFNIEAWSGDGFIPIATHIPSAAAPENTLDLQGAVMKGVVYLDWSAEQYPEDYKFTVYRAESPNYEFKKVFSNLRKTTHGENFPRSNRVVIYALTVTDNQKRESGFSNYYYAFPLENPVNIAITQEDERIILDPKNGYSLYKQDENGTILDVLSSFDHHLDRSQYLALDNNGNVYVTHPGDSYSKRHSVRIFDETFRLIREFGEQGSAHGEFQNPSGIAIWGEQCENNTCRIVVADSGNNRIQVFDTLGNFITAYGSTGVLPGQFNSPQGIAIDESGKIIVSDSGNNRLQILKFDGEKLHFDYAIHNWFRNPTGVTVADSEIIVVADTDNNTIKVLSISGKLIARYDAPNDGNRGFFSAPRGVAVDSRGNIVVADTGKKRIVTIINAFPID